VLEKTDRAKREVFFSVFFFFFAKNPINER